jgi:amidase
MTEDFQIAEAAIGDVHAAYRAGSLSCRRLVEAYVARIEAFDKSGPNINSVITVAPTALEEADRLDTEFARTGELSGPLHGIPIAVKDQLETKGIMTTFGSIAAKGYVPEEDATAVAQVRRAGAIVLTKTAMPDFATSWFGYCSMVGETKNPYALDRDPGGSSGGTGASVAANLAMVGIGEDTGGSIRLPASFDNVVGLKVTPGLISRKGMSSLVIFQDSAGPMARTVTDTAILLDALVGYDPDDPWTAAYAIARISGSFTQYLDPDGLRGAKIGVVRNAFGSDEVPEAAMVNRVIEAALEAIQSAGAELVDVTIPDLQHWIGLTSLYLERSRHDMNAFMAARPALSVNSIDEIYESKQYHPALDLLEDIARGPADPLEVPDYLEKYAAREEFQRLVVNLMASNGLAALCFPSVQVLPPTREELNAGRWTTLTFPTNTLIGAQTWMPALAVPAGFAEGGVPVGIEFLALPYDEATLFRVGYAFEQKTRHRQPPASAPAL